jgi:hypothetical protein
MDKPWVHGVEVANCFCPGRLVREAVSRAKKLLISTGTFQTLFISCREMPELYSQDAGLNRIQPAVISFRFVIILLGLP